MVLNRRKKLILEVGAPAQGKRGGAPAEHFYILCQVGLMLRTVLILFALVAGALALLSLPDMDERSSSVSALAVPVSRLGH